jgi:hypothetical protein
MASRRRFELVVTVKMYGDESADATKSRVFVIAGVVGTEAEWLLATREWVRRTRGLPFHATDCESRNPKDSDEQHQANLDLYRDLTIILAKSHLAGFTYALDLQSYREVFPETLVPDWEYYKCLGDLIGAATRTARDFNGDPQENDDVRLEFTFDSRVESNGTAGALYSMLANHPDWKESGIFDTKIVFESGTSEPRLEMADLLAREAMKDLDRRITKSSRPMRRSFAALQATDKFKFIERGREYWDRLREMVQKPEGFELMEEWDRWLLRTGKVQDGKVARTMQNWVLFNTWIDNQPALRKKYDDAPSSGSRGA